MRSITIRHWAKLSRAVLFTAVAAFGADPARAAIITNWQLAPPTTGNWFVAGNWNQGVPTSADFAIVNNGGTAQVAAGAAQASGLTVGSTAAGAFSQTGGTATIGELFVATAVGSSGTGSISNGTLTASSMFEIGYQGSGQFDQSGGQVIVNANSSGLAGLSTATGVYTLSGGTFSTTKRLAVGNAGQGTFRQSAGTANIHTLILANAAIAHGRYELSGGGVTTTFSIVGGPGAAEFVQTGGTHTVTNLQMGGNAAEYQIGGANSVLNASFLAVAISGNARFSQTGGTVTASGNLGIGSNSDAVGTFDLSGGSLQTMATQVGVAGKATFNQTGGSHTVLTDLIVTQGSSPGFGSATYHLSAGTLQVNGTEYLGYGLNNGGPGTMHQTGGTHSIGGSLILGRSNNGQGTLDISGGTLEIGDNLAVGQNTLAEKKVHITGGQSQIHVHGDFSMGTFNTAANRPMLHATIDATGLTVIDIDGTAALNGQLFVELASGFSFDPNRAYVVLTADGGVSGSLSLGGPDASKYQLVIGPNQVVLSPVPEPSTLALAAFGLIAIGACKRFRSRRG